MYYLMQGDSISHTESTWTKSRGGMVFLMPSYNCCFVQLPSHVHLFVTLWNDPMHARPPCPSPSPKVCPSSCPSHQWYHPAISFSDALFSICPQSFPESGTFPMSQLFALGDQNTGASASASVLPMNIQDWFPLGLTGLISLQSKGPLRIFCNTTVQKHQLFGAQLSLWSNCYIRMGYWKNHSFD